MDRLTTYPLQRFTAGHKIRIGPQMGGWATQTLLPNALERATRSQLANKWSHWLHNLYHLGVRNTLKEGTK